jgi:hypothetical protein
VSMFHKVAGQLEGICKGHGSITIQKHTGERPLHSVRFGEALGFNNRFLRNRCHGWTAFGRGIRNNEMLLRSQWCTVYTL